MLYHRQVLWALELNNSDFHRCLGLENKKGTLRPGADADLVVLDRKGNVLSTWMKGKEVWTHT